jgi:hypothetical protein
MKPIRQKRSEEARPSIKVSMQYHQDRFAKRVWKACLANQDGHFHCFATKSARITPQLERPDDPSRKKRFFSAA